MTTVQVAQGTDNEAGFADIAVEPFVPGLDYPERSAGLPGARYGRGRLQTALTYAILTRTEFNSLRTQLGLDDTADSAQITIRLRGNDDTLQDYNCWVHAPKIDRKLAFWRDVRFELTELEAT